MSFNGRRRTVRPPSLLFVKTLGKLSGGRLSAMTLRSNNDLPFAKKACLTARMLLVYRLCHKKRETQPTLIAKGSLDNSDEQIGGMCSP